MDSIFFSFPYFSDPPQRNEDWNRPQERALLVVVLSVYQVHIYDTPGPELHLIKSMGAEAVIPVCLLRKQRPGDVRSLLGRRASDWRSQGLTPGLPAQRTMYFHFLIFYPAVWELENKCDF